MSLSRYYNRFGGFLLAATMAGTAQGQTAPDPHPLPKTHDMSLTEAQRYQLHRAVGLCEYDVATGVITLVNTETGVRKPEFQTVPRANHDPLRAEWLVTNDRINNLVPGKFTPSHNATLFIHAQDKGTCQLMLQNGRENVPFNRTYVMRDISGLANSKPLEAPKIDE